MEPAVEMWSLNHWTSREVPSLRFIAGQVKGWVVTRCWCFLPGSWWGGQRDWVNLCPCPNFTFSCSPLHSPHQQGCLTHNWYTLTVVVLGCSVTKSCPTLWDPTECSPPASSVHGTSQARMLEWLAPSFSRRSSWPRDWTHIPYTGRRILHH